MFQWDQLKISDADEIISVPCEIFQFQMNNFSALWNSTFPEIFQCLFHIPMKLFQFSKKTCFTRKIVLTPAPVEGGEVDPCDPVDGLRQHEDGGDADDGHGGDAADVQVAEV